MLQVIISHLTYSEIASDLFFVTSLALAWFWPRGGERLWSSMEEFGSKLAERKHLALFCIAAAAVLIRLSLLWYLPIPNPRIHDEFSYLLAADTFAHGRLTNPAHPMRLFLDTIHVNQLPTYMSKYPPAQGAVLALGQLLGCPWIGVTFSVALMCAAVLWMLQGWLPARWALLGGLLVLLRLGVFTYWMNSYWGGAVPAIGGALVTGALPRIFRFQRLRNAVLLGLGAFILANSRPYEGLVLCLPVMVVLAVWLFGRRSPSWSVALPKLILPLLVVGLLSGMFVGYYNWRATGNPFLTPYVLNGQTYFRVPDFIFQKAESPLQYANPQLESFYNGWLRQYWSLNQVDSLRSLLRHTLQMALKLIYFFMWPELCIVFLAMPWLVRDRRMRFLVVQTGVCLLGSFLVIWYLPHYSAPLTATFFALIVQSIRHLRHWEYKRRPVGIGLSRAVVLCALVLTPFHQRGGTLVLEGPTLPLIEYRARFVAQLKAMPGEQLAIVRYAAPSSDAGEWVYNGADIDRAKVVWAREIPGVDIRPLLDYFRGRRVWLVEPDASPPRLSSYPNSP